ncbi:23523_t:CDS:2, partial [Gigaspora margarita]
MTEKYKLKKDNGDFGDWETLYKDVLSHYNIKFIPESRQTYVEIFKSALVINLNEFFAKQNNEIKVNVICIYGDVVQLSNNLEIQNLKCCGIILIAARRFEVKQGCQIFVNYNEEKHFQLLIYAMEMPLELKIIKNQEKFPLRFKINRPTNIGGLISLHSGEFKDILIFDSIILLKKPFSKLLRFSLQIAIALFYEVTRSILTWIVKISEQLKGREEKEFEVVKKLYNHASRMLEQLNAFIEREESKFTLVPQFDMKTYEEHLDRLIKFAEDYENQYKDILKQEHIDKQKIENLKNKLLDHKDITEVHEFLEEVENKQFELSQNVRKEIESKLQENKKQERKNHAVNAFEELKNGIDELLEDQKIAAQKELFFAVLDLSLSIGKVVIQPGSVLNFVDTIKKVSESVQNVLMTMDVKGIKDLANITDDEDVKHDLELAKDLNSKAEEIKKITNELKASRNKAAALRNSTEKMNNELEYFSPENLKERLEIDPKGIILSTHWGNIKNSINKLHESIKPIEQNIKGAEEYFNSLTELINFIDTYIKAKIDENKRSKELSKIQKQVEINNRIKERLEQRIESRLNHKMMKLNSFIKEFNEKYILRMIQELNKVSNNRPQEKWTIIKFKEKNIIDEFKQKKSVKIDIPPDYNELNKYARLRLHTFRLYLQGVGSTNDRIALYINHSDDFYDRDEKTKSIILNQRIKKENLNTYQWEISLNTDTDLSGLESINIHLEVADNYVKNFSFKIAPDFYTFNIPWILSN